MGRFKLFEMDLRAIGSEHIPDESVDLVVTSPPYKQVDGLSDDLMGVLGKMLQRVLKPGGRVFLNFGQLSEDFSRPIRVQSRVLLGGRTDLDKSFLHAGQTIIWVKSIAVPDDLGKVVQRGHYQPLHSDKILNYCWEFVFTFWKHPEKNLDRLSIGVGFTDQSNLTRGTRGQHGNVHCAGDCWYISHETTGVSKKKVHGHQFPEALVEKCIKVSGIPQGSVVMDPFIGGGTVVRVGSRMGMNVVGVEVDSNRCAVLRASHPECA